MKMVRLRRRDYGCSQLLGGVLATLLVGCQSDSWYLADRYPPGPPLAPNESSIDTYTRIEAHKAEADNFVVYDNEWYMGGQQLGPYGTIHATQIAKRLEANPWPVVIQATFDPELDATRRRAYVKYLTDNGIANADTRVMIGFPEAEGLYGEEAPVIYGKLLRSLTVGGGSGGGYGGGAGGVGNYGAQNLFGTSGGIGAFGPLGGAAGISGNRPNFSVY